MAWSTGGSVATYPTVTPAGSAATLSTTLVLRADPGSGIVYINGQFSLNAASGKVFGQALAATFRPLSTVTLIIGTATLTINTNGTVTAANLTAGSYYTVRSFYFTTVTPA